MGQRVVDPVVILPRPSCSRTSRSIWPDARRDQPSRPRSLCPRFAELRGRVYERIPAGPSSAGGDSDIAIEARRP